MALIKCSECGKEISDKAKNCIHCGCPTKNENDSKTNKNQEKKKVNILNIIRYVLGIFFLLMTLFGMNGIAKLFGIITTLCICPISANFIYSKVNIPKALRIAIPIICFILACILSNSSLSKNDTENMKSAYCSKTMAGGSNRYSVKIAGNSKKVEVKGQEIYDSELIGDKMCGYKKTIVSYYGGGVECGKSKDSSDYIVQYSYTTIDDIQKVIKDFENEDYECSIK